MHGYSIDRFDQDQDERVWSDDFKGKSVGRSVIYRLAAAVALDMDMPFSSSLTVRGIKPPYPPHIAGLRNPYEGWRAKRCHTIMRRAAGMS
jgi:hypothetical protein